MKKNKKIIYALLSCIIELMLLVGLVWKHTELYEYTVTVFLLLLLPFILPLFWLILRREYKENRLDQEMRLKLFFFTGPIIFLCLSLILSLSYELKKVSVLGGGTKEMGSEALKEKVSREGIRQWMKDRIEKMKSDRILYSMLLASSCLLFSCRYSSARIRSLKNIDSRSKDMPATKQ